MKVLLLKAWSYVLKVGDFVDGYKTHLANVATPVVQWYGYKHQWSFDAHAVALTVTCALVSFFRMLAHKPGSLAPDA